MRTSEVVAKALAVGGVILMIIGLVAVAAMQPSVPVRYSLFGLASLTCALLASIIEEL